MVPISPSIASGTVYFSHFGNGQGLLSSVFLLNPSEAVGGVACPNGGLLGVQILQVFFDKADLLVGESVSALNPTV